MGSLLGAEVEPSGRPGPARARRPSRSAVGTVAAVLAWLGLRVALGTGAPGSAPSAALGGVVEVLAWAVLVAVANVLSGWVVRRPPGRFAGGAAVLAVGGWQHRLPERYGAPGGELGRFLWQPPGGIPPLPAGGDSPVALLWPIAWTGLDLCVLALVSVPVARVLRARTGPREPVGGARHLVAAGVVVAFVGAVIASTGGLVVDGACDPAMAAAFLTAHAAPLGVTAGLGMLAVRRRLGPVLAAAPFVAMVLDAVAGTIGDPSPWGGVQGFGMWGDAVVGRSPSTVWVTLGVLAAVGAVLISVRQVARAVRWLERAPAGAVWTALAGNTLDAASTAYGLASGVMAELNPLVRAGGIAVKWVAGSVLLIALHRLAPRLVWPVAVAYLMVVAYHVTGLLLLWA